MLRKLSQIKLWYEKSQFFCTENNKKCQDVLSNIRILDLSRVLAGPLCTMVLGDMGAEILKIERPHTGDDTRQWGPFVNGSDSCYFMSVNRNKKSVCIDITRADGQNVLHQLIRNCDVLIENYVPGKLKQYHLDYDTVKNLNKKLIYCSITGYGTKGPYKTRPGYDVIAASVGGLLSITGAENGPPCKPGVALTDISTGLYAHGAILAALLKRTTTGLGQHIQCDLLSTQVSCLINVASAYLNAGQETAPMGTAHASIVPYQSFETKDGFITLGTGNNAQFLDLCQRLNRTDLAQNIRFKDNKSRVENRTELISILTKIFRTKTTNEWVADLCSGTFPVGPVNTVRQVFDEDPHIKEIGIVQNVEQTNGTQIRLVGPAVTFSGGENRIRSAPPRLGEHTKEVLRMVLNYDETEIERLARVKAIVV